MTESDLLPLARRLIACDTSREEGVHEASGFVKGWLEARGVAVEQAECRGLPVLTAEVGDPGGRVLVLHGHLDVVPAEESQFEPRVEGDRLIGRGAYDMKGALAAMLSAFPSPDRAVPGVCVRLAIVGDEESEESEDRGSDYLVDSLGLAGDFAITGEPTDFQVGVAAKGVLALRLVVSGTAAHGSTPWLGENAILTAIGLFRAIESLPFAAEASEHFNRPSVNLGRISGGDALNRVPDRCVMDVDIRYLPGQDPAAIRDQIEGLGADSVETIIEIPAIGDDLHEPSVGALVAAASRHAPGPVATVGRDGASDAISLIRTGTPAVEFGPVGGGHHGPLEWVSIDSLGRYRDALADFMGSFGRAGEAETTDE